MFLPFPVLVGKVQVGRIRREDPREIALKLVSVFLLPSPSSSTLIISSPPTFTTCILHSLSHSLSSHVWDRNRELLRRGDHQRKECAWRRRDRRSRRGSLHRPSPRSCPSTEARSPYRTCGTSEASLVDGRGDEDEDELENADISPLISTSPPVSLLQHSSPSFSSWPTSTGQI